MTTPAEIFSRPQTRHAVLQSCSLAEKNTLPNDTMMKEVYKYTNTKVAIGPFTPTVLMTWLNAHNNPRHRRVTSIFNLNLRLSQAHWRGAGAQAREARGGRCSR
jgi:hypothetical protein